MWKISCRTAKPPRVEDGVDDHKNYWSPAASILLLIFAWGITIKRTFCKQRLSLEVPSFQLRLKDNHKRIGRVREKNILYCSNYLLRCIRQTGISFFPRDSIQSLWSAWVKWRSALSQHSILEIILHWKRTISWYFPGWSSSFGKVWFSFLERLADCLWNVDYRMNRFKMMTLNLFNVKTGDLSAAKLGAHKNFN